MYTPSIDKKIPDFPVGERNTNIELPPLNQIEPGDILISRYGYSQWADHLPWEVWHHAALISNTNPLQIIEAIGPNAGLQPEGPTEITFFDSVGFGKAINIKEIIWLKPVFPDPMRETASWKISRSHRSIITPSEARKRALNYARAQLCEKYAWASSKWSENTWYCSSLIYKSYSRTVTGMYLESYDNFRAGFFVTPEDLMKSKWTQQYFSWINNNDPI